MVGMMALSLSLRDNFVPYDQTQHLIEYLSSSFDPYNTLGFFVIYIERDFFYYSDKYINIYNVLNIKTVCTKKAQHISPIFNLL